MLGRPRRMGTTSGITGFCCTGGENTAPTEGEDDALDGTDGSVLLRLASDSVRPEYIYAYQLQFFPKEASSSHL